SEGLCSDSQSYAILLIPRFSVSRRCTSAELFSQLREGFKDSVHRLNLYIAGVSSLHQVKPPYRGAARGHHALLEGLRMYSALDQASRRTRNHFRHDVYRQLTRS